MKKLVLLCFLALTLIFIALGAIRYLGFKVGMTVSAIPLIIVLMLIILSIFKKTKYRRKKNNKNI